jgi:hypothetical protein
MDQTRRVIEQLQIQGLNQKMKFAARDLEIKYSIEWIVPKSDRDGERVRFDFLFLGSLKPMAWIILQIRNEWRTVKTRLVILSSVFFKKCCEDAVKEGVSPDHFLRILLDGPKVSCVNCF